MSGSPHPKSEQLARGPKRPARIKATPREWLAINLAKRGDCRAKGADCDGLSAWQELHHVVPRSWCGDDVADNIIPLCRHHHRVVTDRSDREVTCRVAESLTDAEYAYVVGKLGEGGMERLFGLEFRAVGDPE